MSLELKIVLGISITLLILLTIVLSSRSRIKRVYRKYLNVGNQSNLTGGQFAQIASEQLDLNLQLGVADGELVDAYNYKTRMLIMSRAVCNSASLASLTIVAHELGHALQHAKNDPMFGLSHIWSKINRFTKKFFVPFLVAGVITLFFNMGLATTFLWISLGIFAFNIFDKIFNIPVEYNASKRALWYLKEYHYLSPSEIGKAKKLLGIAAQTYIASLFDGIIIFGDRLNSIFNKKK